jgi:hypothetical protein
VTLSAQVGLSTSAPTPTFFNWTHAPIKFLLWNSSGTSVPGCTATPATASSTSAACSLSLKIDSYTVQSQFDSGSYYAGAPDNGVSTVYQPQVSVTGGGWVPDDWSGGSTPTVSANNKHGNFGFNVFYDKNGNLRGQAVFVYRASDGNTYMFKSNSWQGGWLTAPNTTSLPAKAAFQGQCNLQVMDASGTFLYSVGNLTCRVDTVDNGEPGANDMYAFAALDGTGNVVHKAGTPGNVPTPGKPSAPLKLGGGNIKIQLK